MSDDEEVPAEKALAALESLIAIAGGLLAHFAGLGKAGEWTALCATFLAIGLIDGSSGVARTYREPARVFAAFILAVILAARIYPEYPNGGSPWLFYFAAYVAVLWIISLAARPIIKAARTAFEAGPKPIVKVNRMIRALVITASVLGLLWTAIARWWMPT